LRPLFGFSAAWGTDVVEGDGASAEEDEGEGEGGQGEGKFVSTVAHESIVEVHLDYGDAQIDADGKGRDASEEAKEDEDGAKEFGEGRDVGGPGRETEAGDKLGVVVESAENFVVSVDEHDGSEG
jgi:hypothetical protein